MCVVSDGYLRSFADGERSIAFGGWWCLNWMGRLNEGDRRKMRIYVYICMIMNADESASSKDPQFIRLSGFPKVPKRESPCCEMKEETEMCLGKRMWNNFAKEGLSTTLFEQVSLLPYIPVSSAK